MRTAATIFLAMLLALSSTGPVLASDSVTPAAPIKAAETTTHVDTTKRDRSVKQRLDPSACAELCRFFERMWLLEKRVPETPAPTS